MLLTLPFLLIIRAGLPFQQHVRNLLAVSLTKPRNVESSQKLRRSKWTSRKVDKIINVKLNLLQTSSNLPSIVKEIDLKNSLPFCHLAVLWFVFGRYTSFQIHYIITIL